jgi:hypothetical protein
MSNGIGKNPLLDISKVYLESVAESAVPGKPAEKLKTDRAGYSIPKADQMSAAERIKKKTAEKKAALEKKHGMKMDDHPEFPKKKYVDEKLDPVGQEDGDIDNDGDKDSSDKYLLKRRKAIGKAMGKRLKESRSLTEVMTDDEDQKEIKEKSGIKNKIKINPKLGEAVEDMGGTLLEAIEVDEFDVAVESVYEELIEEGYTEDEVEYGIQTALNTIEEGYYDSAVAASKAAAAKNAGETPKRSMKDRLKSAAKKAIMGTARAAGKAVKAKAAVQAAPDKARAKARSIADRVKSAAKAGYAQGRGPVEKKETSYRNVGAGRKEKIGEAVYGGTPAKKEEPKDTRMTVTAADKKGNTPAYQKFKAGDKRYKAADHLGEKLNLKKTQWGT